MGVVIEEGRYRQKNVKLDDWDNIPSHIWRFCVGESRWIGVREARGGVEIFAVVNCVGVFIGDE